ncbi:MAG: DNA repair protein RecN [Treponema sp.]
MLENLSIRNIALIDSLEINFSKGFNVLSGETGAGKSILINSIVFLLGGKSSTDIIRHGAEEASVSAIFSINKNSENAKKWLALHQIEPENEQVLIRRTLKNNGRSLIWVEGIPISRNELVDFTAFLIDIHGQHDHQSLFKISEHRRLLDGFAGIENDVKKFTKMYTELASLRERYASIIEKEKDKKEREEFLHFAIEEIEKARLKDGEEEKLEDEKSRLSHFEKLFSTVKDIVEVFNRENGGINGLRKVNHYFDDAKDMDKNLISYAKRFETAFYEIEDISESIFSYYSNMSFSPERLEEIESRLSLIYKLEKKYGPSIKDVLNYYENAKASLENENNATEAKDVLLKNIKTLEASILDLGHFITKKRKENTKKLQEEVENILKNLNMSKARFGVNITTKEENEGRLTANPFGFDEVEFMISANPGEDLKPLAKVASGGEISRIMLSLKTVLCENDEVETLIFDEIDTGIGGEVALSLASHIKKLSEKKQILCITHLAVIASHADNHIKVEKEITSGSTFTKAFVIEKEQRTEEIARMLSGDELNPVAFSHASQLLERYSK